jgi:hypothetical protein
MMEGIYILCGVGGLFLIGSTCIILDMIYNVEQKVFIRIKKPESIAEEHSIITDEYDF